MLTIHPSTRFKRSFKRMPRRIKTDFIRKIDVFKKHPYDSTLHTHKLSGRLGEYHSFYLKEHFRVLFQFVESEDVLLVNIGSHDDYQQWARG